MTESGYGIPDAGTDQATTDGSPTHLVVAAASTPAKDQRGPGTPRMIDTGVRFVGSTSLIDKASTKITN